MTALHAPTAKARRGKGPRGRRELRLKRLQTEQARVADRQRGEKASMYALDRGARLLLTPV